MALVWNPKTFCTLKSEQAIQFVPDKIQSHTYQYKASHRDVGVTSSLSLHALLPFGFAASLWPASDAAAHPTSGRLLSSGNRTEGLGLSALATPDRVASNQTACEARLEPALENGHHTTTTSATAKPIPMLAGLKTASMAPSHKRQSPRAYALPQHCTRTAPGRGQPNAPALGD
ncbi:hypothetical protein BT67DRAFT_437391 [Trichocladium antarcticum]|uniref:Uncharacterized protein n=1 Tax=Trichocladium antarcticum TaxID=1450529 RepID=A0AAN6UBK3_9PEZI|nr:hypothetical protein BT67DRAFT_437391 [Trichocladium antarcticum]